MYGLNIHLHSFDIYSKEIHHNDKIRVSITTVPEEKKQAFIVDADKVNDVHQFFTVNITKQTEKLIVVFRRKSLIRGDPIIASTIIRNEDIPKTRTNCLNAPIKQIAIYEPVFGLKNNDNSVANRRILGQMKIQLSLEEAFPEEAFSSRYNYNISRIHKGEGYSCVGPFDFNNNNNNENSIQNNSLFIDNFVTVN